MEPINIQSALSYPKTILEEILHLSPDAGRRFRRLRFSLPMALGCGILSILLIVVLVGPEIARYEPGKINTGVRLSPPNSNHWLGTDALGRDMFSRVAQGLQISLSISLGAILITAVPGILLGLCGGYYQGWVDQVLSRLIEVLLSLPSLLLAIVLIARLGPSIHTLIFALGITGIPTFYRVTRNETLSTARLPFIEASRSLGLSSFSVIFRHILPNIFSTLLVMISMRMGIFLLMGSGLSFIGLGIQPPLAELGGLLATGKAYYQTAWWLVVYPGAAIFLAVLGFNMLGEGLRDGMDI